MELLTEGLKATDRRITLGKLSLCTADNEAGKTALAEALRVVALGYVPILGARPQDTARLIRDRELSVSLTLDDGRIFTRTVSGNGKGGYGTTAKCSWLGDKAARDEHDAAILALFGSDKQEIAEALDLRELINATPNKRTERIQKLLESTARKPEELAKLITRYLAQRLADVADERMPEDYRSLVPLIPASQLSVFRTEQTMLIAKLNETGVAGALAWANEQKRAATNEVRHKTAARGELLQRAQGLGTPDPERLSQLQQQRTDLDREIGAAAQRQQSRTKQRQAITSAQQALAQAESELHRISEECEACEAQRPTLENKRNLLVGFERERTELPSPPAPDYREATGLVDQAIELEGQAEAIPTGNGTAALASLEVEVERLTALRDAAERNPWRSIIERVVTLKQETKEHITRNRILKQIIEKWCDETYQYAKGQQGDADATKLARELEEATARLTEARGADAASVNAQRRAELLGDAKDKRDQAERIRRDIDRKYANALEAHKKARATLDAKHAELTRDIAAMEQRAQRSAECRRDAEQAMDAARQRLEDLGAQAVEAADPEDESAGFAEERARVVAQIEQLTNAAAARAQLDAIVAEIDLQESRKVVFAALEEATRRVSHEELNRAGGPLVEIMDQFLKAAGREEGAIVRADFVGWRDTTTKDVSIETMSGAQWTIYVAAMASAILILRGAAVRLLIVEADSCDDRRIGQLLRGISAVADRLTSCLVLRWRGVEDVPAGWQRVALDGGQPARAAA